MASRPMIDMFPSSAMKEERRRREEYRRLCRALEAAMLNCRSHMLLAQKFLAARDIPSAQESVSQALAATETLAVASA